MKLNRRQFALGFAATMLATNSEAQQATTEAKMPAGAGGHAYFFKDPTFEYVFLVSLGRAYQQAGNVGKVLWLTRQVRDGDHESAYQAFKSAGDEAAAMADASLRAGHRDSARQAFLWAQNYYDSAMYFVDGSADPTRLLPTWELLYGCWLKSVPLFRTPVESVLITYEDTQLHGFYFKAREGASKRPLLILVNGSDGSLLDMWTWGAAGAVARGYDCLTFDGPGQGYALWKQKLFFRPDWEKVITPVVDFALARPDVDPRKIAIQGISQGGYWVPRAVAFERRIAAAVADPGVVDVSTSWTGSMPAAMLEMLKAGKKAEFDATMDKQVPASMKRAIAFRMRPYGLTSYYDTYKAVMAYNISDVASQIRCPLLITAPANEAFWPGQSQRLYELAAGPKKLVPFTESDGADLHCEPKGVGIRELRIFDWLDEVLSV
jgi:alpha-beta hydrolase superfamily lysophospholipase